MLLHLELNVSNGLNTIVFGQHIDPTGAIGNEKNSDNRQEWR
jgi:hypothetical protein